MEEHLTRWLMAILPFINGVSKLTQRDKAVKDRIKC